MFTIEDDCDSSKTHLNPSIDEIDDLVEQNNWHNTEIMMIEDWSKEK